MFSKKKLMKTKSSIIPERILTKCIKLDSFFFLDCVRGCQHRYWFERRKNFFCVYIICWTFFLFFVLYLSGVHLFEDEENAPVKSQWMCANWNIRIFGDFVIRNEKKKSFCVCRYCVRVYLFLCNNQKYLRNLTPLICWIAQYVWAAELHIIGAIIVWESATWKIIIRIVKIQIATIRFVVFLIQVASTVIAPPTTTVIT